MAKRTDSKSAKRAKPAARAPRRKTEARSDGYVNRVSGHGTSRDRRTATTFQADVVTDIEALELWRSEDIAARIIETAPREALRRGYEIKAQDKELSESISHSAAKLKINEHVMKAGQMERAYGGAAIFPVMDVGIGDLEDPLDESSVGEIKALHVLEPRELHAATYYKDITSPKFGQPETYRLVPINSSTTATYNVKIHESRLVIFPGLRVTRQISRYQRPGWGDSALSRPRSIVADYGLAWSGAAHLLTDFAQGVLKLDGFADLSAQQADDVIDSRLAAINQARSTIKMLVIDKLDEFSRQTTPLTGLSDILIQMAQRVAAAADMPLTILMGMSPAGLNATGDMDIRAWYDRVAGLQEYYRPRIEQLIRLMLLSVDGPTQGNVPDNWSIDFHPLWSPTEMERATTRKTIADTDAIYIDRNVVTPAIVAESRWKGDTFSGEMVIDWAALAKQQAISAIQPVNLNAGDLAALNPNAAPPELDANGVPVVSVPDAKPVETAPVEVSTLAPDIAPEVAPTSVPTSNEALNGAQVTSLVTVVTACVNGEISRETAAAIIKLAYNVSAEVAMSLLGPENFVPRSAAPAPAHASTEEPVAAAA